MMPTNPNNPLGQSPLGSLAPGRVIESTERYWFPSGRFRDLYRITSTLQGPDSVFRTLDFVEVKPPLDCSCIPQTMNDIAECTRCQAITCRSVHSFTCPSCGCPHCTGCRVDLEVEAKDVEPNGEPKRVIQVCRTCADELELQTHPILKLIRKIWE